MRLPKMARPGPRMAGGGRRVALFSIVAALASAVTLPTGGPALAAVEAEGVVCETANSQVVPDSYIVVLKDTVVRAQGLDGLARGLSSKFGGTLRHTYHSALHGFAVKGMGETQARRLAADPAVAYVQKDTIIRLATTQTSPPSWGLDRIDQRNLPLDNSYTYPTTASNVHAYIIDTGIHITHSEFGGRAVAGFDAVTSGGTADDCNGHGTHVAGTVGGSTYGVAKGVQLVAVRVLDCGGLGDTSGVVAGIDWVTANAIKPAVANMSLGGDADPTEDAAVQHSIASGVTYTVAAGNGDDQGNPLDACGESPARVPAAITVGATDISDQRASWSNYGTCLDIFAPGVNITSAWNSSDTATNTLDGTSMAAPHVAGAAALVLSANPGYTPAQVRDALVGDATPDVVGDAGMGSPNRLLVLGQPIVSPPATLNNPRFGTTEVYARTNTNHVVYKYYSGGWSGWMDLGGDAAGDPTVLYNPRFGTTEVYVRTNANTLAYRYYSNGWSDWMDLGGNVGSKLAVLYNPRFGTTEVYARSSANKVAYRYFLNGWSGWMDLGGDAAGDPTVLYNPRFGTTEVYVRTNANTLAYRYYSNGWSDWMDLGGNVGSKLAVLYNPRFGTTEVYARSSANKVAYRYFLNGWSGWNDLGGDAAGDPTVLYNPRFGTTEVYARSSANKVAYQYFLNGWSGWNDLGGPMAGDPGLLYNPRFGTTEVYSQTSANRVVYRYFLNGWSDWTEMAPP